MIKNKSGHIVGITSVQGKISPPFRTSYAGSKHAIIAILDSLRC
jgi:dehydrogenase/reductase SDR family protein 7B